MEYGYVKKQFSQVLSKFQGGGTLNSSSISNSETR